MNIFLSIIIVLLIVAFVAIVLAARTKIRHLREESEQMVRRIRGLVEEVAGLKRQLTVEALHGKAAQLTTKLNTARAPVAAQIERYKHQNNELRVFMSAVHRHLNNIVDSARINPQQPEIDGAALRRATDKAMDHWRKVNDWLSANKIEPYLGHVPGVPQKEVAQA